MIEKSVNQDREESHKILPVFFLAICGLLLIGQNRGPDAVPYQIWAASLSKLQLPGMDTAYQSESDRIWSPIGIPYTQRYPGAGGMQILPLQLVKWLQIKSSVIYSIFWVGSICLCLFITAIFLSIERNFLNLTLGLALAIFATPLGLNVVASGTTAQISLLPLCLLVFAVKDYLTCRPVSHFSLGLSLVILASVRPYLMIYALAVSAVVLIYERKSLKPIAYLIHMASLIIALGIFFACNYVMTGHLLTGPQDFGDAKFSTIDLFQPTYAYDFLFCTYNGAFSIHPLVATLPLTIGFCIFRLFHSNRRESVLLMALAVVIPVHFYVQSCWFYWNMEIGFGQRSIVIPGLICVYTTMRTIQLASGWFKNLVLIVAVVCLSYSFLLSLRYESKYFEWGQLISEIQFELFDWIGFGLFNSNVDWIGKLELGIRPVLLLSSLTFSFFLLRVSVKYHDRLPYFSSLLSLTLCLAYAIDRIFLIEISLQQLYWSIAFPLILILLVTIARFWFRWDQRRIALFARRSTSVFLSLSLSIFLICHFCATRSALAEHRRQEISALIPYGAWGEVLRQRENLWVLAIANGSRYQLQMEEIDQFLDRNLGQLNESQLLTGALADLKNRMDIRRHFDSENSSENEQVRRIYAGLNRLQFQKSKVKY